MKELSAKKHYLLAFWITLVTSISLIIAGFFTPPMGEISGSVLTAVGELFLWPALAFGYKALEEQHNVKITHKNTTIEANPRD